MKGISGRSTSESRVFAGKTWINPRCCSAVPSDQETVGSVRNENKSPVAPFRVVNIGNSRPEKLLDFINAIEIATGHEAKINWMPIQPGDVPATWADTSLLADLTNFTPKTDLAVGVKKFVDWYTKFHKVM